MISKRFLKSFPTPFVLLVAALMLALSACVTGDSDAPSDAPEPTVAASATETPVAVTATEEPSPTPLATEGDLFLQLVAPEEAEITTSESSLTVVGRTRVDAVVTVDDSIVEPDVDGRFSSAVELEEGPNIIEVVASVATGEQEDLVLVVIYLP